MIIIVMIMVSTMIPMMVIDKNHSNGMMNVGWFRNVFDIILGWSWYGIRSFLHAFEMMLGWCWDGFDMIWKWFNMCFIWLSRDWRNGSGMILRLCWHEFGMTLAWFSRDCPGPPFPQASHQASACLIGILITGAFNNQRWRLPYRALPAHKGSRPPPRLARSSNNIWGEMFDIFQCYVGTICSTFSNDMWGHISDIFQW